jgi:hypothetical protein
MPNQKDRIVDWTQSLVETRAGLEQAETAVAIAQTPLERALAGRQFGQVVDQFLDDTLPYIFPNEAARQRFLTRQAEEIVGRLFVLTNTILLRLESEALNPTPLSIGQLTKMADTCAKLVAAFKSSAPAQVSTAELDSKLAELESRKAKLLALQKGPEGA